MGKHKNTVLVQAIYGAFLRGDLPAILSKLDDKVEWIEGNPGGSDVVPTFGTYKGKDGVSQFFQKINDNLEFKVFDPHEYIAQYDKVIALVRMELTIKKTGKAINYENVMVWTIKDGKVTHFRAFPDSAANVAGFTP